MRTGEDAGLAPPLAEPSHHHVLHARCPQILVGNKSDMADEKRAVPYSKGKALADEYGVHFFETSAKENINVEEVRNAVCVC